MNLPFRAEWRRRGHVVRSPRRKSKLEELGALASDIYDMQPLMVCKLMFLPWVEEI